MSTNFPCHLRDRVTHIRLMSILSVLAVPEPAHSHRDCLSKLTFALSLVPLPTTWRENFFFQVFFAETAEDGEKQIRRQPPQSTQRGIREVITTLGDCQLVTGWILTRATFPEIIQ